MNQNQLNALTNQYKLTISELSDRLDDGAIQNADLHDLAIGTKKIE